LKSDIFAGILVVLGLVQEAFFEVFGLRTTKRN
jgi:hypothetical protein